MRTKFGGKKRRGYSPAQLRKGSGSSIRTVRQQVEQAKLVEQKAKNNHKGRVVTDAGLSLITKACKAVTNEQKQ
jgi:small subunit ribosomal protein S19e